MEHLRKIVFQKLYQLVFIVQMDPFFQRLLVSLGQKFCFVRKNAKRVRGPVFPQGNISITDPQKKSKYQGNI